MGVVHTDGRLRRARAVVVTSGTQPRFNRADWLELGLAALAESGPGGLTIEALCRRAGKTKGSFYAHFDAIEGYCAALASHWRESYTLRLMQEADKGGAPRQKLAALDRLAAALDHGVEQGMRRLGHLVAEVATACAEVDRERIAYLAELHAGTGRFAPAEALALARFEYAAFIGFQQLDIGLSPGDLDAGYRLFQRLLDRGGPA